jgi:hypothetical protein
MDIMDDSTIIITIGLSISFTVATYFYRTHIVSKIIDVIVESKYLLGLDKSAQLPQLVENMDNDIVRVIFMHVGGELTNGDPTKYPHILDCKNIRDFFTLHPHASYSITKVIAETEMMDEVILT